MDEIEPELLAPVEHHHLVAIRVPTSMKDSIEDPHLDDHIGECQHFAGNIPTEIGAKVAERMVHVLGKQTDDGGLAFRIIATLLLVEEVHLATKGLHATTFKGFPDEVRSVEADGLFVEWEGRRIERRILES